MDEQAFKGRYDQTIGVYADLGVAIHRILGELLAADEIIVHSIDHRVKGRSSALRKFTSKTGPERDFESMTDLLGLRVITYLRDAVDEVAQVVEREFTIDEHNSVDKRAVLDPDRFGYLSMHYVASLDDARAQITEYARFANLKFEVQIRSILQHAWAEIEHDLGYKARLAIPREVRRNFSRLAGLLELADDQFVEMRDRLTAHQEATETEIARGDQDLDIDQDSVSAYIQSNSSLQSLDKAIGEIARGPGYHNTEASRSYAGERAVELRTLEMRTIRDVATAVESDLSDVEDFARRWLLDDFPGAEALPPMDSPELEAYDFSAGVADSLSSEQEASRRKWVGAGNLRYGRSGQRVSATLDWPRGVGLFYLYLYRMGLRALAEYDRAQEWPAYVPPVDRVLAACASAVLGRTPVPVA